MDASYGVSRNTLRPVSELTNPLGTEQRGSASNNRRHPKSLTTDAILYMGE